MAMLGKKLGKKNILAITENLMLPLVFLLSIFVFLTGSLLLDKDIILIALIIIWCFSLICYKDRNNIMMFAFLITFSTFLMGTIFVYLFDETNYLFVDNTEAAIVHTYQCLYISLFSLFCGHELAKHIGNGTNKSINLEKRSRKQIYIRNMSKYVFMLTAICSVMVSGEKILFYISTGDYSAYYTSFISILPELIRKLAEVNIFAFFIYVATLPTPKDSKSVFLIYLFIGFLGLLYGQRNQIILSLLFIMLYCVIYENRIKKPYSIISKKYYFLAILLLPLLMLFLDFFMYFREGRVYEFMSVFKSIENLINNLGRSVNIIAYGYDLKFNFPVNKIYSLGGIVDFFTKNIFMQVLLGTEIYHGQTIEMALYGNSFGQTITYMINSSAYLNGAGFGSCYIAEAYHDFGYAGVCFFNIIYGFILTKINKLQSNSIMVNTMMFMSLYYILYAPRDSAGHFIAAYFNFIFLITAFSIYVLAGTI